MDYRTNITADVVRQLLDYNPETGVFIWRKRPVSMFTDSYHPASHAAAKWNTRYAGKAAGYLHDGYISISILKIRYRAHRLAWLHFYGEWPKDQLDHIDRNRSNDKISNLREASNAENQQNRSKSPDCSSAYVGVSWNKKTRKWQAYIKINGSRRHLGYFTSENNAAAVYAKAKSGIHTFNPTPVSQPENNFS